MDNKLNDHLNATSIITSLIESDNFLNLDTNLQDKIIDTVHNDKGKDGGVMGKFLGANPSNVSMHVSLILCGLLILLLVIDSIRSWCTKESINMDLVNSIVPVISLAIGYIFGKGTN